MGEKKTRKSQTVLNIQTAPGTYICLKHKTFKKYVIRSKHITHTCLFNSDSYSYFLITNKPNEWFILWDWNFNVCSSSSKHFSCHLIEFSLQRFIRLLQNLYSLTWDVLTFKIEAYMVSECQEGDSISFGWSYIAQTCFIHQIDSFEMENWLKY